MTGSPVGRVHLVGAGPGDPDLLTVRAERLLRTAEVVVHDRLVGAGVLRIVPPGARLFDVGKTGYGASAEQARIIELLIRLAHEGSDVVRLKGGDPFVFARGGEELLALRAAGVPVHVVPGITAGIAAPATIGVPLTHRGLARNVAFVAGRSETDDPAADDEPAASAGHGPAATDWGALARLDTLVVYMAGRTAANVGRRLLAAGRPPGTPVAVIVDATLEGQEAHITDLRSLAHDGAPPAAAGRATILVVGDVVRLTAPPATLLAAVGAPGA